MRKLILTVFTFFSLVSAPAISYAEAKRTALARNPSGRVIKVSSVI